MQTVDLRIPLPVPRRAGRYLPLISLVLALLLSVFRLVHPVVLQARDALQALENEDPQLIQEIRAQQPM